MLRAMVRFLLDRIGSEQIRKQRNAQYLSRVKHLEEIEANRRANLMVTPAERERGRSIRATSSDAFFAKQVEEGVSAQVAINLMQAFRKAKSGEGASQQPKLD